DIGTIGGITIKQINHCNAGCRFRVPVLSQKTAEIRAKPGGAKALLFFSAWIARLPYGMNINRSRRCPPMGSLLKSVIPRDSALCITGHIYMKNKTVVFDLDSVTNQVREGVSLWHPCAQR